MNDITQKAVDNFTNAVFPDVEDLVFAEYASIEDIKDSCDVVIDTNVLVIPYIADSKQLNTIGDT